MSEEYRFQLSVKIDGSHLLNLRAEKADEFGQMLAWAVDNAEQIQAATAALEGAQKAATAPRDSPPPPAPVPVPAASYVTPPGAGEVGPVLIKSVSKTSLKKDGTPMRSPRYVVEFSNGKKIGTIDGTLGQSAEALSGQSVYYSVTVNGDFTNLAEVRRA